MPAKKIMIVDDDKDFLEEVADMLRGSGYEVATTDMSTAAVEMARTEKPDIILLDVQMPLMSGVQVAAKLRSVIETARIPVILITGFYSSEDRSFLRSIYTIKKCIRKPFKPSDLIASIEETLKTGHN